MRCGTYGRRRLCSSYDPSWRADLEGFGSMFTGRERPGGSACVVCCTENLQARVGIVDSLEANHGCLSEYGVAAWR